MLIDNVWPQYIVPVIALFHSQIIDKPEQAMTETIYSTGGKVEHQVHPQFDTESTCAGLETSTW
jgi:hypothetical protein